MADFWTGFATSLGEQAKRRSEERRRLKQLLNLEEREEKRILATEKRKQQYSIEAEKRKEKYTIAGEEREAAREKGQFDPKAILQLIAGITPPEQGLPPDVLSQVMPRTLGPAEGGQVLTPPGATFEGGEIRGPAGKRIGEYAPGYEPKPFPQAVGPMVGQQMGITPQEALRETMGLPKAMGPTWQQKQKVSSVKAGLQRGTGVITKAWGELEEMPVKSYADAMKVIQFNRLSPADFQTELEFYKSIVNTGKIGNRIVAQLTDGRVVYLDTREEVVEE